MPTNWLKAHLMNYGEGGYSKKAKKYRVYDIVVLQKKMKVDARLILMGAALFYWETRLRVWQRDSFMSKGDDTVFRFVPAHQTWTSLGKGIEIPLYFVFDRWHIKQNVQSKLARSTWLSPAQEEMKTLIDVMEGKRK